MSNRTSSTIVVAVILIGLIMGVTAVMTFSASGAPAKYTTQVVWSQPYSSAESMKIIDLTGDKQKDLFIQNSTNFGVLDAAGKTIFSQDLPSPLVTTMGDVNGDGTDDIVAASWQGSAVGVAVFSLNEQLWTANLDDLGQPARAAVVRFPSGPQIVVGDNIGNLDGLNASGKKLWHSNLSSGDAIRGLDDALIGGKVFLAAANHDGSVALFDNTGQTRWTYSLGQIIRRLRSYDLNGNGDSEILLGGEQGKIVALNAATGQELFTRFAGQAVTEIRDGELNGEPSSREFVAGGKNGGVWAYTSTGESLWTGSVGDKVKEIASIDVEGDGTEAVLIGDDGGGGTLFANGKSNGVESHSSGITRIDAGKLSGSHQAAIADGSQVELVSIDKTSAPFWYTPLLAGLIASVVVAVGAWVITTIPAKPATRVTVEDQSVEGLQARRLMLHESIADVERLKQSGEMPANAYLARLKDLRSQLADTEAALSKAGVSIKPEIFKCPNCGGSLPLGVDKCEYCGQVVIA